MKLYAVTNLDDSIDIVTLILDTYWDGSSCTIETELARNNRLYKKYREITRDHLPNDRDFRNAWTDQYSTPTVDIDIQKAKDLALTKLRDDRQKQFVALGVPYPLAPTLEANVLPQATRDKLQRLRDWTNPLKSISKTGQASQADIDQLKALRDDLQTKTIDQL